MIGDPIRVRVWAPWACFTRPEFHVERVTYPVITPSAARGVLEAILMQPIEKPESGRRGNKVGFRWHVLRIGILKRGLVVALLRNELGYQSHHFGGYEISSVRAQRNSLVLKDVDYLVESVIEVPDASRDAGESSTLGKYQGMFLRRVKSGQCYHRPYLGCREFPCHFDWAPDLEPSNEQGRRESFGPMLRDLDYDSVWRHWPQGHPRPEKWSDGVSPVAPQPISFMAEAVDGWISVAELREAGGRQEVVNR